MHPGTERPLAPPATRAALIPAAFLAVLVLVSCTSSGLPGAGDTLDQSDKAFQTDVNVALTNAAKAQQGYAASNGSFATDVSALVAESGLNLSPNVTVRVARADTTGFCMEATHDRAEGTWHIASGGASVESGPC